MRRFGDLNLTRKLTVIIMLTTIAAMLLSAVAIISYQVHTFSKFIVSELATTAEILGTNGAAALRFRMPRDAEITLSSLKAKRHIRGAFFLTAAGDVFSSYSREGAQLHMPPSPLVEGSTFLFEEDVVVLVKHIIQDGDHIGTVCIQSDLDILYSQIKQSCGVTLLIIVACSSLALSLALKSLRRVSQPIIELVDVANRVSDSRDYSLRAHKYADDDLGSLTDEFNDMLHQIETRDADLQQEIRDRQQAHAELEHQRTLTLRSDRLRSLGEMAAGIAHELNQPLVGVRGMAEHILIALERGWDLGSEKLAERAQHIVDQADRMTHIIEHVRMFARESGKPDLRDVQLNDVVSSGVDLLKAQLSSHGIALTADLADGLPSVWANPYSLEEVLLNLLTNARDAIEEREAHHVLSGHGHISVTTHLCTNGPGGSIVCMEVRDNGRGIPESVEEKIFDPFFTTKDPDKGTGLGLAICKSIVEDLKGSLEIVSTSGMGVTATVSLPALKS